MSSSQPLSSPGPAERAPTVAARASRPAAGERYTATAQALHWLTAALMFVVLPLAWAGASVPDAAPGHEALISLHKSVGLTILAVVAVRLAWRAAHPPPPLSADVARWEERASTASHWMLYAILIGMPLSGYLLSASAGRPTSCFGLVRLPGVRDSPDLRHAALLIHVIAGQWLVYALILLHLAATAWHVTVRRDGVLDRMLPPQG